MMDYLQLAAEIETKTFSDSAVHKYIGSNVKSPRLIRGLHYIIKYWSFKSLPVGSDNQYWLGQFIGAGESPEAILPDTPRAITMTSNQRYFFKRPNDEYVAAANFEGALVINDDNEQRITFYALLGEAQQNALPLTAPAMRTDKARPVEPAKGPREHAQTSSMQTARVKKERNESFDSDNVEQFTERMRVIFAKSAAPIYRNFLVAQFNTSNEAKRFAERFNDGFYVEDGLAHTARAPEDLNENSGFVQLAKDQGAVSCHIYKKQINS